MLVTPTSSSSPTACAACGQQRPPDGAAVGELGRLGWLDSAGLVRRWVPASVGRAGATVALSSLVLVLGGPRAGKSVLAHALGAALGDATWGAVAPGAGQVVISDHHPDELAPECADPSATDLLARAARSGSCLVLVRRDPERHAHRAIDPATTVLLFASDPLDDDTARVLLGLSAQDAPDPIHLARRLRPGQALYRAPAPRLGRYGPVALLEVAAAEPAVLSPEPRFGRL